MKLVFNASMPRAGSELLQVLLHQNPRIYGSATSPLLEYQFATRGNYNLAEVKSQEPELMHKAFLNMCKGMAMSYYKPITDRPVVIDKNRGWSHYYEWVDQWNPDPKMICVVRDLRSIVASMERVYRKNRHIPEGPDNPVQIQGMTTAQRVQYWLSTQPIGLALARTLDCFQRGLGEKMLFIRYEDLTTSPQEVLNAVYAFIGEEPFTHDFTNIVKEVKEDDSHFGIFGNHQVKKNLLPAKPGDWQDVLTKDIASGIRQSNKWYFDTFGY